MKKRHVIASALLSIGLLLGGCDLMTGNNAAGAGRVVDRDLTNAEKSICGTYDIQFINQYDGTLGVSIDFVNTHEAKVGAMTSPYGSKFCTGTLISRNRFLTAGHCIDSGTTSDFVTFNYEVSSTGAPLVEDKYAITRVLESEIGGLDYAILELAGNPGDKYGWTPIKSATPASGDTLCIIQHPSGRAKMIEAGPFYSVLGDYFTYTDLDTEGGSSGSGVLDMTGSIIAVHTNGGCSSTGGYNRGVSITSISKVSPIINEMLGGDPLPTFTPVPTSTPSPTPDPTGNTWDAAAVYDKGDRVQYFQFIWEAKWWNQGDEPGADQWGPWTKIGPIGTATPTPIVTATFTSTPTPTHTATPVATETPIVTVTPTVIVTPTSTPIITPTPTATSHPAYPEWTLNESYTAGDIVTYNGILYQAVVTHTAYDAGWNPASAPTLWSLY